ncbi:MAG TPA: S8 family serine peptidase, partial [Roseimicrobium sp.]|nr:S8 family serine peptidase [Roseimicrobium sp.]
MEAGKVAEMFGAKLKRKASELSDTVVGTPKFLAPEGELQVPEDMAAEVDYAYIPEPPVFFNVNHVPPQASVYHLRVEDMARVVRAYSCHRQGWTGNGVKVVMADSGFAKHPFFEHYGFNITRVTTPTLSNPELDPSGHGTGESANCLVIAPDCTFVGVKHDDYSAEALETSIAQSPRIITNSWGWDIDTLSAAELQQSDPNMYNEFRDLDRIIKQAVADGICVVFSAGNGHRSFPGNHPDVISAGGVTVQANGALQASSYASSFVSKLFPGRQAPDFCGVVGSSGTSPQKGHIMLPVPNGCELEGENLTPALSNLGWGIFTGTSAAAPQIAGLAALILSANPSLKPADIKSILAATATDVTTGTTANGNTATVGNDLATGSGFVNAFRACLKAQQMIGP